jgi:arylformamidase
MAHCIPLFSYIQSVIAKINFQDKILTIDLSKPIDISIPLRAGNETVNAWYVDEMRIDPVRTEHFLGSVEEGGHVNFRDISFNPHGNGTHTECVGHIDKHVHSINETLNRTFFFGELITIEPEVWSQTEEWREIGDRIIHKQQLEEVLKNNPEALIIRTSPNSDEKCKMHYSNTNPPYLSHSAAKAIRDAGVKHLLIDLPSVDREKDGGQMLAHKAFWNFPNNPIKDATITELIYVRNEIEDGSYLLEIQIAPFVNDASPSKPTLYSLL